MDEELERKRRLLNNFYRIVMKPKDVTADQYREIMQEKLECAPLDATYNEIHAVQRSLYKKYRGGRFVGE